MAEYRFTAAFIEGSGTITLDSLTYAPSVIWIEEGNVFSIDVIPDSGFVFDRMVINGITNVFVLPHTFTMPDRDTRIKLFATGVPVSVEDYGIKYQSSFCDIEGKNYLLQVLRKDYVGSIFQKLSADIVFKWGSSGGNEFESIINSSLDFSLVGLRNEFDEILVGDYRDWQVRLLRDNQLFWKGYVNNSLLSKRIVGFEQPIRFTASDGLNGWESVRTVDNFFPGFGLNMGGALVSMVNQTFLEKRNVNFASEIYETRLDRDISAFHQLAIPPNAIYTQGDQPTFLGDGQLVLSTALSIKEAIENLLRPFLCRVFLWQNQFYIISIPEFNKPSYRLFKYDTDGVFDEIENVTLGPDISCGFTDGIENARPVKTEFTGILELGVLDFNARGGVYEVDFSIQFWEPGSFASPFPGILYLPRWIYVRATPANVVTTYPTGTNDAIIQYVSDNFGESVQIWGTTSSAGLADAAISYIEISQSRTGQDIAIAQELANTISFEIKYLCKLRSSTSPLPTSAQKCGIQFQIGDQYLAYDEMTNVFSWSGTPTVMLFPIPNVNAWNTVSIVNVVVPTTGDFNIRLYELITTGTVDQHTISYKDLSVKIDNNDSFTLSDIVSKFITDEKYSNVDDEYKVKIGDVGTSNSSSAIRIIDPLNSNPFTELWSRDGVEQLPLMQILLQEIANVRGKPNPRIILTLLRNGNDPFDIKPYQNIEFEGFFYMVNSIEVDFLKDFWKLEIIRLGEIGT